MFKGLKRFFRSKNPTPKQMRDEIKRDRVRQFGEVFTPEPIVKAMVNMVEEQDPVTFNRIDATFLEPSFGTGNFLVEILQRKMDIAARDYGYDQKKYESAILKGLDSIYGVELLEDNVEIARERMFKKFKTRYEAEYPNYNPLVEELAKSIFVKNLVCGNFLTKQDKSGNTIWFLADD